jgi:hypothetical protein
VGLGRAIENVFKSNSCKELDLRMVRFLRGATRFPILIFCVYFFIHRVLSRNGPVIYDGLAARIRTLRSKDHGRQTVGGMT